MSQFYFGVALGASLLLSLEFIIILGCAIFKYRKDNRKKGME